MWFNNAQSNSYLEDPFLSGIADDVEACPPVRPAVVDLTHKCNLRCAGCYFFAEDMDKHKAPRAEAEFDAFVESEKKRGTNYMTVVGGEPALQLGRLKKLHENFHILPYTNGAIPIPRRDGFEDLNIAISLWGGHETDKLLRGGGKQDVFAEALLNYRNDPRVVWYYTTTPGNAHEIMPVVEEIVDNQNFIMFSFYEDHESMGGSFDHRNGFGEVHDKILEAIRKYPEWILTTPYLSQIGTMNKLYGQSWGHDVCPVISTDHQKNAQRITNGFPFAQHMRVFLPDLKTTRRCPVGEDHDCSACYNVLARLSWIMVNRDLHLDSKAEFENWLTATYMFHVFTGLISRKQAREKIATIQRRLAAAAETAEQRVLVSA